MANKVLASISLGLCVIALGMSCGSIFYPNWTNYEISADESYEFGLFKMTDEDSASTNPDSVGSTGMCRLMYWCGFEDEFDDVNAYESLCDTATKSVTGSICYYVCICLANVIMVTYMICQVSILLDKDPGHKFAMIGKSIMFTVLATVGFAGWWGISKAGYDIDCEWEDVQEELADGDDFDLCAGDGATFSIITFGFMFFAGAMAIANSFIQAHDIEVDYSSETPICCGPKIHFAIIMFFLMAVIGLSIGLWFVNWVHFEIDQGLVDDDWDGRILYIKDYDLSPQVNLDLYGWDCLSVDPCDVDDDSTSCKSFDPLYKAGEAYLHLEVTSLFFVVLLTSFLGQALLFSREWAHPILVYGFAQLQWIFQLVAISSWAGLSEVKFEMDDCSNDDVDSDEAYDICIRAGPVISIVQLLIQVVIGCYFSVIFYKRGTSKVMEIIPTVQTEGQDQPQTKSGNVTENDGIAMTSKR